MNVKSANSAPNLNFIAFNFSYEMSLCLDRGTKLEAGLETFPNIKNLSCYLV